MWAYACLDFLPLFLFWPLFCLAGLIDVIFLTRTAYLILCDFDVTDRYHRRGSIGAFVWWTIAAFLILYLFGKFNLIEFVRDQPILALRRLGFYFVLGFGYMLVRGASALLSHKDKVIAKLRKDQVGYFEAARRTKPEATDDELRAEWLKSVKERQLDKPIQVKEHKGRITAWVFLWLPDLAYQVVFRFVDRIGDIWDFVWRMIRGALQSIANALWGDITKKI